MTEPDPFAALTDPAGGFIAELPKVELHVHHVGSASPTIVAQLAERHPGKVPTDPQLLAEYFRFRDFAHFVEVYLSVTDLITTGEDVRMLTDAVAGEMTGQNIRYAEVTVTPYLSVQRGIAAQEFVEAIEDARIGAAQNYGIELRWIFDIPGDFGLPAAEETLRIALDHGPSALVGFGLGGSEIGVPRSQFKPYFDAARAAGLHSVPHAGETTGPQTIWDALRDLGAERIGHGTSAAQDPELLAYLARHEIPVEVCPTSNLATGAVSDLTTHPIIAMVEAGVRVSINSDDPPMFATTLNREYGIAARLLGLDDIGVGNLAKSAVRSSFAERALQDRLMAEIDAYMAASNSE